MNTGTTTNRVYYRVNKNWYAKPLPKIVATGVENRTKVFLKLFWLQYTPRKNAWDRYKIKPQVLICIAWADTHLWYATKSKNNIWNVGNNDRWDTVEYDSIEKWINAIAYTLNNRYMWTKQIIGDLSFAGNCKTNCSKVYATSNSNRETNVSNCLSLLYKEQINANFEFRK